MPTYQIQVENERTSIDVKTGDYRMVVVAAAAQLGIAEPCIVTVWCEELLPDYGPYRYSLSSDRFGRLVVTTA